MAGNPVAHPQSVVVCGSARFTLLTPRLIRLEWSSRAQFEDRASFAFPTRYADPTPHTCEQTGSQFHIQTEPLSLDYTDDGEPFGADNLTIRVDLNGQTVEWTPGTLNTGNLRGTLRTLDQCAGAASLQEGLISRDGWSLHDDSGTPVWDAEGFWVESRHEHQAQDWYFFGYGHDYTAALADYLHFGGDIPLIPRYVLGGWWSRFWAYSADDLLELVNQFEAHEVPLDVLVVDMDWHTPDAWTGYTWNRQLFPDPEAFLSQIHRRGLYVTLNLHPAQGVQKHEQVYPQFAELLGQDPAQGEAIRFRPSDQTFMQHYFELLHHPMEEQGVDFWWLDWQQGDVSDLKGLDPLPWLNHLHFRDSARRGTRPMLYSRWGGLGNHRYPIGFSGDTYATWESLRFQSYMTPTAANVAYGWWSHDIGGHFWATDPELYARWVQFGAVSPCLRLHSTKDPLAERRPWAFPAPVFEAAKAAFQFRYQLLPYLYSAARAASQQGLALCLPMYYRYPDAEDAYLAREQYFLGDQMFVAPVVQPADPATGLASVDVWIPEGRWIEYSTLETYTGSRWIRLQVGLDRIPMFVKAGGIVPLAPQLNRTRDWDGSHLIVTVYPGADGQFTLYEDDGISEAYTRGEYETTALTSTLLDEGIAVHVDAAQGRCAVLPETRNVEFRLRAMQPPSRVQIGEQTVADWTYDLAQHELTVTVAGADRRQPLDLRVSAAPKTPVQPTEAIGEPFVHVVDYTTVEDARQQLGAIVVASPAPHFDAHVQWELHSESATAVHSNVLKNCTGSQIVTCPFADDESQHAFRWRVSVTFYAADALNDFSYESREAYPSLNRWQTLIYRRDQEQHALVDVLTADGQLNPSLDWQPVSQTNAVNLKQPFVLLLPEADRAQMVTDEQLEAYVATSLYGGGQQDAVLHVQSVGEAVCSLNRVPLSPCDPVSDRLSMPMYPSWMTPKHLYFDLPLKPGENALVIFTRPDIAAGRWGVGATVLDRSGKNLLKNGDIT